MSSALFIHKTVPWVISRAKSTGSLRGKPSRMVLSRDVGNRNVRAPRASSADRGPWANVNQIKVPLHGRVRAKSEAALKRSSRGRPEAEDVTAKESPLYKALKMQTALAPLNYGLRTAIKKKIADITSFEKFPLLPVVSDSIYTQALPGLTDVVPTPIQKVAVPAILETNDKKLSKKKRSGDEECTFDQYLLAAETGSGKTLAYLIPVIDNMKREEAIEAEKEAQLEKLKEEQHQKKIEAGIFELEPPPLSENLTTSAGRPRVLILLPTTELVNQVGAKVKAFSHTVKFRSGLISSSDSAKKIRNIVFQPNGIDILVSTPHLVASIAKTEPYLLSRVTHIIADEADSLFDRSFAPTTTEIIEKSASSLKKLILCSATIPRHLDSLLRKRYPETRRLVTPNLHAIPRRVQLGVVDIDKDPYRGNRSLACADVIWSLGKAGSVEHSGPFKSYLEPPDKKIIVFVNEREEAEEVSEFLRSKGIEAYCFSRDSSERHRTDVLADFTEQRQPPSQEEILQAQKMRRLENSNIPFEGIDQMPGIENKQSSSRRLAKTKVLVTTDLGSRGIDTLPVRTVILYHVPHTTIDFIHRLGRVGRMGRRGRGIILVGKKDRKDVVREVRDAMYQGQALI